jgi:hypothetical protein
VIGDAWGCFARTHAHTSDWAHAHMRTGMCGWAIDTKSHVGLGGGGTGVHGRAILSQQMHLQGHGCTTAGPLLATATRGGRWGLCCAVARPGLGGGAQLTVHQGSDNNHNQGSTLVVGGRGAGDKSLTGNGRRGWEGEWEWERKSPKRSMQLGCN